MNTSNVGASRESGTNALVADGQPEDLSRQSGSTPNDIALTGIPARFPSIGPYGTVHPHPLHMPSMQSMPPEGLPQFKVHQYRDPFTRQWTNFTPATDATGPITHPFSVCCRYESNAEGETGKTWIVLHDSALIFILEKSLPDYDWPEEKRLLVCSILADLNI
jgi:hypothetical protein